MTTIGQVIYKMIVNDLIFLVHTVISACYTSPHRVSVSKLDQIAVYFMNTSPEMMMASLGPPVMKPMLILLKENYLHYSCYWTVS